MEERTRFVYPVLPSMECPSEPKLDILANDADFAAWVEAMRIAGDTCRIRLLGVHDSAAAWPQPGASQTPASQ